MATTIIGLNLNQHVVAMLASMNGFAVGVTLGWNSLAGMSLRMADGWDTNDGDLVVSIFSAGAAVGSLAVPLILWAMHSLPAVGNPSGLRGAMAYAALPLLLFGWILVCIDDYSFILLVAGRILHGMAIGILYLMSPLYIAEISSGDCRDTNLYYFHVLLSAGVTCAYGVAAAATIPEGTTLEMSRYSLGCAVACLSGLLTCAAPTSPVQLLLNDDDETAKKSIGYLGWYSGDLHMVELVDRATTQMRTALLPGLRQPRRLKEETIQKILKNARFWGKVALATGIMTCQQLSGSTPIIFNALTFIDYAGSGELTSSQVILVCGAVHTIGSILGLALISRVGRRILLTISSAIMGLSLILLAWFIREREVNPDINFPYYWIPPTAIILIFGSYSLGFGPISWSLLADSFPMELRILTTSIIATVGWLLCLILNLQISVLLMFLDIPGTLWLFSAFCCLAAIVAGIFVRESSGKSLADIQEEFQNS